MSIPEIKPMDLAAVIRQAILHGRGYDCNPETKVVWIDDLGEILSLKEENV